MAALNNGQTTAMANDVDIFDACKRAVYKRAPTRFSFKHLDPVKLGGNYLYGLRILPLTSDSELGSIRSGTSDQDAEYAIWRRWQDCLYLQSVIEEEYTILVKGQKSQRIKMTTSYNSTSSTIVHSPLRKDPWLHSSRDAKHATDVHVYLPRLSTTGTVFAPNSKTVGTRAAEFREFITALLGDGIPPALRALRGNRLVHDFFGYWRRDYDIAKRTGFVQEVVLRDMPIPQSRPSSLAASRLARAMSQASSTYTDSSVQSPSMSTFSGATSVTSASSELGHNNTPWASMTPNETFSARVGRLRPRARTMVAETPSTTVRSHKSHYAVESEHQRRLAELANLVVHVDTTEEVFEDKRSTLKADHQYDVETHAFTSTSPHSPASISISPPSISSPPRSIKASSLKSSGSDVHRARSSSSTDSHPSRAPSSASVHTSNTSLSQRSRPLPAPPPPPKPSSSRESDRSNYNVLQPVPQGLVPDARIMLNPTLSTPSPLPRQGSRQGLPAPPASRRSEHGTISRNPLPQAPPLQRMESTETFGGASDSEQDYGDNVASSSSIQWNHPASLNSRSPSSLSFASAHVQTGVSGRLSIAVPRVVWVNPRISHPIEQQHPARLGGGGFSPGEGEKHSRRSSTLSLSGLDDLDKDVNERWWRSSHASGSTVKPEHTPVASTYEDYPPDEFLDDSIPGSPNSESGNAIGDEEAYLSPPLSSGIPSPDFRKQKYSTSAQSMTPRTASPYTQSSHASTSSSRHGHSAGSERSRHVHTTALPPNAMGYDYDAYARSLGARRSTSSQPSQHKDKTNRVKDWVQHVPSTPVEPARLDLHRTSLLLNSLMPAQALPKQSPSPPVSPPAYMADFRPLSPSPGTSAAAKAWRYGPRPRPEVGVRST